MSTVSILPAPVLWRIQRPVRIAQGALAAFAIAAVWMPGTILAAFIIALMCAALMAELYFTIRAQRLRRHVEANGFRVCPSCVCPLVGLRAKQNCPECGEAYDAGVPPAMWNGPDALGR